MLACGCSADKLLVIRASLALMRVRALPLYVPRTERNCSEKWAPEVEHFCPGAPIVLVGTKSDLRHDPRTIEELAKSREAPVTTEAAMQVCKKLNMYDYVECSALKKQNIREVFELCTRAALSRSKRGSRRGGCALL